MTVVESRVHTTSEHFFDIRRWIPVQIQQLELEDSLLLLHAYYRQREE